MKSLRVDLEYSEAALAPLHAGLCASPDLDRELVLGGQSVDGVETVTSFVDGDPDAYEALLVEQDGVREYDVAPTEDGCFVYLRRELGPEGVSLLGALARETVVVVPPIQVRSDRTMGLRLVGHPDDLQAVMADTPEGVTMDVRAVADSLTTPGTALSDRQLAALRVARAAGYYEVPRRNGIERVASELDCAVSTASEVLRRGEAHAVDRLLDDRP